MKHASLYSGFGGFDLAAEWMGWENVFWCEINDFCRTVLNYWLYKSKGYGNIKETDFTPWRGKIDILTGGFPCQPFSVAGQRKGSADDRYLWPEMLRAIREIQPTWVIGENVAGILSMVQPSSEITVESQASLFETADKETLLDEEYVVETICRDFEQEGYCVQPFVIPACAVGAPHRRDRVWFIAHRADTGVESLQQGGENGIYEFRTASNPDGTGRFQLGNRRSIFDQEQLSEDKKTKRYKQPVGIGRRSKMDAPYPYQFDGNMSGFCSGSLPQFKASGIRPDSHAYYQRCKEHRFASQPKESGFNDGLSYAQRRGWRNFPSQSPVCRGNDGLPFDVDGLTISYGKWTEESIKGYGNAIVPDVAYAIFELIENIENSDYEK